MNAHVGMASQKIRNCFGLMCAQVITDDVYRLLVGLTGEQVFQKCDELCTGVTGRSAANDLTAGGMQRCVQGQRSVSLVLKTVSFGPTWGQRQNRIQAVQCLDSALFVHTEDHCIQRGLEKHSPRIPSQFKAFR
jgi:hypothetical protein